ncbi:uncharacterized protein MYCFIDRAFT_177350 [Pseudocercospora fijiensis CIRAD86]|uniref:Uncharacterized protein n=1 Tax=Pseudocercospora fijiensis (strain CIRAD86) TaxID=383855 RepID=M2ZMS2_PSEFD|nr:uncharacterized protein MYCFIDRAFT_177350 [Pseudocercospora fijiensis CIRAD86]EME80404.1 hypothetical protein MYCFIDRAFT_177350 [Pseudocercospora fijiensis CIRAD86]
MHEKDIKTSQALPSFVKLCAIVLEKAGASEGRYATRRSAAAIDDCVDVSGVEIWLVEMRFLGHFERVVYQIRRFDAFQSIWLAAERTNSCEVVFSGGAEDREEEGDSMAGYNDQQDNMMTKRSLPSAKA